MSGRAVLCPDDAKADIATQARVLGFDSVGFAAAARRGPVDEDFDAFIAQGRHGDMDWLARNPERRTSPQGLWPEARSVIAVGLNYGPASDPLDLLKARDRAVVSVYAQGGDYHTVLKKRLKQLARFIAKTFAAEVKVFVDTAPVMEKPAAARAGLGWQGKHTNLVSREFGSWLFLGEVFTTLELEPDEPEVDHCGSCQACLDICPTAAFTAAHQLDPRRCISYLTIEHRGHIAREFRAPMGNRVYGCDDCLAVCPWNKFAAPTREPAFLPRAELTAPRLADLAALDDGAFRALFAGSPIKRTGRDRFVRNVLIAMGNSGDAGLAAVAEGRLDDPSPLVRAMAVWALWRLLDSATFATLREAHCEGESDTDVRAEWQAEN
ncbi:MAG: tRNA epoxyqueuosine(34) reductase QueG [Alphaproteobacteria bacterium]